MAARYEIDRINMELDFELPESDEYETIGGLMINFLETIPEVDEEVIIQNYRLVAEEVTDSRIERVRIYLMNKD